MAILARDTEWMARRAERNRLKAQEFRADVLDARRNAFWSTFAGHVKDTVVAPSHDNVLAE